MKSLLDFQLIGLNQVSRDKIKNKVNEFIEQEDIWKDITVNEYQNEEGQWVLFVSVPFFENFKRNSLRGKIRSEIMKTWHVCEEGSYIALHDCDHDEEIRRGCKIKRILEKLPP